MNKKKMSKVQKIILVVLTFVILLTAAGLYFLHFKPLVAEQEQVKKSLQTETKLLEAIEQQKNEQEEVDYVSKSLELQNQLPLHPYLEQVFSTINEAEAIASSTVLNYNISETTEVNVGNVERLNGVTLDLSVESPSYAKMVQFLDQLEQSDRLVSIHSISFSSGDADAIQYELNVRAYYVEGFEALKANQPMMNIPNPSNKTNPLR